LKESIAYVPIKYETSFLFIWSSMYKRLGLTLKPLTLATNSTFLNVV
jgi:hypothetical protein